MSCAVVNNGKQIVGQRDRQHVATLVPSHAAGLTECCYKAPSGSFPQLMLGEHSECLRERA